MKSSDCENHTARAIPTIIRVILFAPLRGYSAGERWFASDPFPANSELQNLDSRMFSRLSIVILNRMEVLQRMNLRSQFDRESIEFPMTPK
jgi:hypothetical protein